MTPPRRRFVLAGPVLLDQATGLGWATGPSPLPVPWADAEAAAAGLGQRLPSAAELMTLLVGLEPSFPGPAPGDVVWSASGSPFAPASRVRAIACERPNLFVVVLLERTDRARWWGVQRTRVLQELP
jgi:hypothetical protein